MKKIILLISLCLFSSVSWSNCIGDCANGQGTYTWPDGEKYVGQFKDDKSNGQGTLTLADGRKYVGQFKDGKSNGQGTLNWPDGQKYVGQWKDDKFDGQGTYTWPDGRKYVGQFKDDIPILGQGTDYLPDGRELVYQGDNTKLFSANGQLLKSDVPNSELKVIRAESAEIKRYADEQLATEQQEKDRQFAAKQRRDKKLIMGIQQQLGNHQYLRGTADGIAGTKTFNAIKEFYWDSGITRPALDDFTTIARDLSSRTLSSYGNCTTNPKNSARFSVCFTVNTTIESAEIFLRNSAKEDITTTASGLQYRVLTAGSGPQPTLESTVEVHYAGRLLDGTEFDSSIKRGVPAQFGVTQVIKGWTEALQLMSEGSKWELTIPPDLAYGSPGSAVIGPNEVLIFEVELLKANVVAE